MLVPFAYQIEESFDERGQATFDPSRELVPRGEDETLAASWMRVVRCPNDECDRAWALMLYPTAKSLFDEDEEAAGFPA